MYAIHDKIALMLVRNHLAGLRGYPTRVEGETLLVETVQKACKSVDHAERVLGYFDDECPTPKEIKDTALSTAPPEPDPRPEWEKKYGPPRPIIPDFTPINEARHETLWRLLKEKFKGQPWPKTDTVISAARELGFEDYADAWERCGMAFEPWATRKRA